MEEEAAPPLTTTSQRVGSVLFVTLHGEVDLHNVSLLHEILSDGLRDTSCTDVVADLADVPFMDSSGYGAFLTAMQQVDGRGGHIHLVLCHPYVARMLEITRLNRVFQIHQTIEEARAAVSAKSAL